MTEGNVWMTEGDACIPEGGGCAGGDLASRTGCARKKGFKALRLPSAYAYRTA